MTRPLAGRLLAVCAPNAFKGTVTAQAAAAAMARGVRDAGAEAIEMPVADGGDGTLDVLLRTRRTEARVTRHRVTGPTGAPVTARLGWFGQDEAVVELAEASGLRRLEAGTLDALHATSRGTGELIRIALDAGARTIVVGVGGSASTDGGAGLLQALGARLTRADGKEIGPGGAGLEELVAIDLTAALPALTTVLDPGCLRHSSPLLGPQGPARMFAPQKGASADDVLRLERALTHFAAVASACGYEDLTSLPGAGAAGGCGFGLAIAGAHLVPGARLVCDLVGLDDSVGRGATVVITGEGRLDRTDIDREGACRGRDTRREPRRSLHRDRRLRARSAARVVQRGAVARRLRSPALIRWATPEHVCAGPRDGRSKTCTLPPVPAGTF